MSLAVQLNQVGKLLGRRWVLSDITFNVNPGESIALFGGNGSGKSTLLKILATLMQPTTGKLQLLGLDPHRKRQVVRQRVLMVAHEKQLYSTLTVMETLRLTADLRGLGPEANLEEVAERCGLSFFRNRTVGQLSEGMRKRLVLARMLVVPQGVELILLDEPHPTLDREGRALLDTLIGEWRHSKKTLFLASHDHREVLPHAERLLILEEGQLKYDGPPREIPS